MVYLMIRYKFKITGDLDAPKDLMIYGIYFGISIGVFFILWAIRKSMDNKDTSKKCVTCVTNCFSSMRNCFYETLSNLMFKCSKTDTLKYGESYLWSNKFTMIFRSIWLVAYIFRVEWWRWTDANHDGAIKRMSIKFLVFLDMVSLGICIFNGMLISIPYLKAKPGIFDKCSFNYRVFLMCSFGTQIHWMYENIHWLVEDPGAASIPNWQWLCWILETFFRGFILIPVFFEYHYYPLGRSFVVYFAWQYKTWAFCFFNMQMDELMGKIKPGQPHEMTLE